MILIRRAKSTELEDIQKVFKSSKLSPQEYLNQNTTEYMVVEQDGSIIGVGGLEIYEDMAVINSVAVIPQYRHKGFGDGLVRALINFADRRKVKKILLFTEDAHGFFEKIGFKLIERDERLKALDQYLSCTNCTPMELDIRDFFMNIHC